MKSEDITGAPYPFTLINKEGEETEFRAKALSDRALDSLSLWIQSQVVAVAKAALKEQLEEGEIELGEYQEDLALAMKAAISVSLYEVHGASIINTPKGVARLAWEMTRDEHPDVKFTDLKPYMKRAENYAEVLTVFNHLNQTEGTTPDPKDEGEE